MVKPSDTDLRERFANEHLLTKVTAECRERRAAHVSFAVGSSYVRVGSVSGAWRST